MKKIIGFILFVLMLGSVSATTIVLDDPSAVKCTGEEDCEKAKIGTGSWANADSKFGLWLDPTAMFGSAITIDDIAEIEYSTYKDEAQSGLNFYISLYTKAINDDASSWFQSRLTLEPMYSKNFDDKIGEWNTWSTAAGTNQLTVYDAPRSGAYGWYYPPTMAEVQAGAIDWNSYIGTAPVTSYDYGSEELSWIVIDTGSAWTEGFEANVDALTVTLVTGESVTIDLEGDCEEEVPEFGVIGALVALGGAGLFISKRRK